MLVITKQERQIAFPAAIRLAGYKSIERWCEAHGIASSYAYQVLRGMQSDRIEHEIDQIIDEWFGGSGSVMRKLRARLSKEQKHRLGVTEPEEPTDAVQREFPDDEENVA